MEELYVVLLGHTFHEDVAEKKYKYNNDKDLSKVIQSFLFFGILGICARYKVNFLAARNVGESITEATSEQSVVWHEWDFISAS